MNLKKIITTALFTPMDDTGKNWGLPLLFSGGSGIAKTAVIQQVADSLNLYRDTIMLSNRDPADVAGMPFIEDGNAILAAPAWAVKATRAERGIVFFDELSTAAPAVQAVALRVVLDKIAGEYELSSGIRFIAAMNPPEDAAGGWDLTPPMANRFGHIDWPVPSVDSWVEWLMGANEDDFETQTDPAELEQSVMAQWAKPWAVARGLVAGFLKRMPHHLYAQPKASSPQASRAWPSPRTWEYATRAMASAKIHGLSDEDTTLLMGSFVGMDVMVEFNSWLRQADLPDPEDVLRGNVEFAHDPIRLDRSIAVYSSCAAYAISRGDEDDKITLCEKLWEMLGDVVEDAPDIAMIPAMSLVKAKQFKSPNAMKILNDLNPVVATVM